MHVCTRVPGQNISKSYDRIFITFSGGAESGKRNKRLDFGGDFDSFLILDDFPYFLAIRDTA